MRPCGWRRKLKEEVDGDDMEARFDSGRRLIVQRLAGATDLTIHLNGSQPITRNTVKVQCDAQGSKMGLPSGYFRLSI
jgi:hypothetical protein